MPFRMFSYFCQLIPEELESDLIANDSETGTEESNEIEVDYE